jgi:hypothetical protein
LTKYRGCPKSFSSRPWSPSSPRARPSSRRPIANAPTRSNTGATCVKRAKGSWSSNLTAC